MSHQPIEELDLFRLFEELPDWTWQKVQDWDPFAKKTVGDQLVRAMDSVNANLVEGDGRYAPNDSIRFFIIARASARESHLWIARSIKRGFIDEAEGRENLGKLERASKLLNLLIDYRRRALQKTAVRESREAYDTDEGLDRLAG